MNNILKSGCSLSLKVNHFSFKCFKVSLYMILNSFKSIKTWIFSSTSLLRGNKIDGTNSRIRYYSFSTSQTQDDPEIVELFAYELKNIKDMNSFLKAADLLASIATSDKVQLQTKRQFFHKLIDQFPNKIDEEQNIQQLQQVSETIVRLYQIKIEYIDPEMIITTSKLVSSYNTRYFKSYWHFVEFLLTRTNFLKTFTEEHVVELLGSYYSIEKSLEPDKYQYIFDKLEEYFCIQQKTSLNEDQLRKVLFYYTKSNLGGPLLYSIFFKRFNDIKPQMNLENFISCAWSFVTFNLRIKDKSIKVYDKDSHLRVTNNIENLNSYYLKQFLWSYHKEKELFG